MAVFDDKTILITGGTGSFGTKFTELLLKDYHPHSVRIFSRGELLQMQMQKKFEKDSGPGGRLRFLIGDVRDRSRISRAMNGVDIVVHAAAMKQVPACEYNPREAVRTNIDGTINVVDAAIDNEVERVLALSSDKAVHPVNLYGATKMVAEKIFIQANVFVHDTGRPKFSCVRYGNVVGSRGSVIPVFREQIADGNKHLTITDERMTRFWITLDQGSRFVMRAVGEMVGGEIFVPKIPSMKVIDIARAMIPNYDYVVTGIRPGEKLHEVLLTEDEARHALEFDDMFVIEPEFPFWVPGGTDALMDGKRLPDGFRYSSDINIEWLSKSDLKEMLDPCTGDPDLVVV